MKFKYTGEGEITLREVTFKAGRPVEVTCENFAAKLSALDCFDTVRPRKKPDDQDVA